MHIQIVLFDGFDLLDAIAPYEVFCAAQMYTGEDLHVELVTAEGARLVSSGIGGLQIPASGRIDPEKGGLILVPGASGEVAGEGEHTVPSILRRAMETKLTPLMKEAMQRSDLTVATVCGGSLLLAMGGLLEGRHAVTNHLGMDVLGATGAIPITARIVDDGNLVTGGGVTSGLDVAIYLVERELGPRIALEVESLFEFERRGTVWRDQGLPVVQQAPAAADSAVGHESYNQHQGSKDTPTDNLFDGEWKAAISTPVGKMSVMLNIQTRDGHIYGEARQGSEVAAFKDPIRRGNQLTWSQRVTKPMRLNLKFEVMVEGNSMTGVAKAGVLPASRLVGERLVGSNKL
ncbi:DJ-1/PfpI family protein [Paenibacillus alba]|uniref:DJ-1/PfpI family protein n=1 Tax=Paenibacillus alba TaxID=1197127 RepID=A0ABU6G8R1_9BACL|nr:DJ-1/PfpI family protein [Paenibacillus alba]MEC0229662.1 DJ-1/PfpI family protein [Paenibacillus alba]